MFVILTGPRSGSHLLQTLLDSHPALKVYDEILGYRKNEKDFYTLGAGEGCLVDYPNILPGHHMAEGNDVPRILKRIRASKVIHLTRDLRQRAESMLFYREKKRHKSVRRGNAWKPLGFSQADDVRYDENELATLMQSLEARQATVLDSLKDVREGWLEVDYEWLTGGREVRSLPMDKSTVLCEYLGVEPRELVTPLFKMREFDRKVEDDGGSDTASGRNGGPNQ